MQKAYSYLNVTNEDRVHMSTYDVYIIHMYNNRYKIQIRN